MTIFEKASSGIIEKPYYIIVYGEAGLGKSTFASEAPKPFFLCAEEGTSRLNVERAELTQFSEFIDAIKDFKELEHEYQTLVIDTVDHLEPLIFREVCKDQGKKSIEDIGYARGYIYALDYWKQLTDSLEELRNIKKMNIVLLAHSETKAFNDPQLTESYDRYQIKLHHKASKFLVDRVEAVLFVNYKTFINKSGTTQKTKALGDGTRTVFTEHRPAFIAKNRYDLPFEIPLSWNDFHQLSQAPKNIDPEALVKNIESLLGEVKDTSLKEKISAHVEKVKTNSLELLKVENRLKLIVSAA